MHTYRSLIKRNNVYAHGFESCNIVVPCDRSRDTLRVQDSLFDHGIPELTNRDEYMNPLQHEPNRNQDVEYTGFLAHYLECQIQQLEPE